MSDIIRLVATAFIWTLVAIMVVFAGPQTNDLVGLAAILGVGATISTVAVWASGAGRPTNQGTISSKSKRDHHLSRLVDKLDEEDIYQLEELLAARRDDEIVGRK